MKKSAIFGMWLSACSTWAQPSTAEADLLRLMEGTLYTVSHRETADGRLSACGLEFNVIARDHATRAGAAVQGIGSFYLRRMGANFAYALKLGVRDGINPEARPFAPSNAFVRPPRGNAPTTRAIRTESDTPGYALYLGALDDDIARVYQSITEQRRFIVGFNRRAGQQDVNLDIDLSVKAARMEGNRLVRDRTSEMVDEFNACVGDLLK
ncbi:hypothetical protein [Variovorax sp. UC122_21]|uniref:hypothetical protein n=1 Tax=Variovorax sp. UC122_21 TaxID=3374554 RepID=UPI0037584790